MDPAAMVAAAVASMKYRPPFHVDDDAVVRDADGTAVDDGISSGLVRSEWAFKVGPPEVTQRNEVLVCREHLDVIEAVHAVARRDFG